MRTENAGRLALDAFGWINTESNWFTHPDRPGEIISCNRRGSGAWTHSKRYSTGYKILARSTDGYTLRPRLERLTGAEPRR